MFGRANWSTLIQAVSFAVALAVVAAVLTGAVAIPEPVTAVIRWGKLLHMFK